MALPKQVEKQADEAELLRQQLYEGQASASEEAQPASVDGETEGGEDGDAKFEQDDERQAEQPAASAQAPVAPEVAKPGEDAAYWKRRFETIQGKFDAEVPRLYAQLRDQSELLKTLSQRIEAPKSEATPKADAPLVSQEEINAFGDDLIDVVRRVSREEIRAILATEKKALDEKVSAVETKVGDVASRVRQSAAESFWHEVTKLVPDWGTVDKDPSWIAWLDTSPEFSTATYRELAGQAMSLGDFTKIAKLVEVWRRDVGAASANSSTPTPTPANARRPSSELERQVTPSSVRASGGSPTSPRIYTADEYQALYDVRNVNQFGAKRAAEMIAEADRAVMEGRVRW